MPSDYHFAIQQVITDLMKRRLAEPEVLDDVERLCLLNIALVEARPEAVALDLEGATDRGFVQMYCFPVLITLYAEEGALAEALAIAQRALRFGHCQDDYDRLTTRLASVAAEDEA